MQKVPRRSAILLATNNVYKVQSAYRSVVGAAVQYALAASFVNGFNNYKNLRRYLKGEKPIVKEYPKDVVVLYQFHRALRAPSVSPFALKLETWLRMTDIKYVNVFSAQRSSRGQIPFIKLNDYVIEDSQFIVDYLTKVFNKDLNKELSDEQRAFGRCILKANEESLKWCMAYHRFWLCNNGKNETGLPLVVYWLMRFNIYRGAYAQGYGRLKKEELYEVGKKDLAALNTIIGSKKFLLTNDKPCEYDASVFGMFVQLIDHDRGPLNYFIMTECPNIIRFVNTMKELYWKDWNENIRLKPIVNSGNATGYTASRLSFLKKILRNPFKK